MVITQNISVDLLRQNTNPVIQAKQYDVNSRFLNVTVLADGNPVSVNQTDIVRINVLRADNESNSFVGSVNANGTITVPIDGWILLVPGQSKLSVSISSATNSEIKSLSFQIYVEPAEYKKDVYVVYYARSEAISAGSYYVEIDNKAYSFTLGSEVPVGGVIAFNFAFTLASTYTSSALVNEIETNLPVVNSATGTELQEVNPILQSVIDSVQGKAEANNVYTKHEVDILLSEKAFRLAVESVLADKVDKLALEEKLTDDIRLEFNPSTYALELVYTDEDDVTHSLGSADLPLENILLGANLVGNVLTLTFRVGSDETQSVEIDLSDMLSNALAGKANSADVYTKTESNNLLSAKADKSTTYTKSEVDSALSGKANSNSVYDKTAADELLSGKADKASTYTKTEVDSGLAAKVDKTALETKLTDKISLDFNSSTYVLTLKYTDDGNTVHTLGTVDLPLENILLGASVSGSVLTMTFKLGTDETKTVSIDLSSALSSAVAGKADAADVGSLSNLTTTVKTSIVAAINEINSGLANKANSADVYAKSDTYSKTEVDTALDGKQDTLTFDNAPTENSTNPVKSGGVHTALAGKADLVDGKVPAEQLPSYVDDVVEYAGTANFPLTGESGKIYVDSTTNKSYRWSGSDYVEISSSLALGETASTAYAGNKGKANADAISALQTAMQGKANVDGYYKGMIVGYSEQLLSEGVQSTEAFKTRTTAGSADVTSGLSQIKKIKGKTINWNQLVTNGNFDGKTGWSVNSSTAITSFTTSDNVSTLEVASSGSIFAQLRYAVIGHKYALRYTIKSSVDGVKVGTNYGEGASSGITDYFTIGTNWTICSRLLEATSTARYFYIYVNTAGTYNVKNAMLFDLTQMFGAGNEPTLDEFNAMFPEEYYTAIDRELISCKPSGMQTVGFNLCQTSVSDVVEKEIENAGGSYALTSTERTTVIAWLKRLQRYNKTLKWEITATPSEDVTEGDDQSFGGLVLQAGLQDVLTISPRDSVSLEGIDLDSVTDITLYGAPIGSTITSTTLSNACMHFVWSGIRNGDYEPYQQNTLAIDTATYFPNGMRSVATVYDEMDFVTHKAITRCGFRAYESGDEEDTDVITDGTNTVYALAEQTEVSLPDHGIAYYQADDYGTETWLQTGNPNHSAPVGSELFYYANLRDRLQHLPDLASADGNYLIKQTGTQMELIAGYSKAEIDTLVGSIDSALTTILYGTGGNE